MRKETILVTGNAGFIGSHIVDRFVDEGFTVIGIDHTQKKDKLKHINQKISFFNVELSDDVSVQEIIEKYTPTHIVHHASNLVDVARSIQTPWIAQQDILMTTKLLEFAKLHNLQHVVFASSANVYGNQTVLPIKESSPIRPLSPYGLAKIAVEEYLSYFSQRYSIPTTIFRYFNVYGERQPKASLAAIPSFINSTLLGKEITIRGGDQTRDFVYVKDVARANIMAAKQKAHGTYNIGNGKQIVIKDVLKQIEELTGKKQKVKSIIPDSADCKYSQASISKVKEIIGWKPETSFEQGLQQTVEYYKSIM